MRGQDGQGTPAQRHGDQAHRHVDQEDVAPVGILDEPPAQDRAERWRQQDGDAEQAHDQATPLWRREAIEERHADGHQHAAAQALQHAERDQQRGARRERAQQRAEREERQGDQVEPLGAEAVGEPAREGDDRRLRQQVAGDDPLHGVQVGREDALQGGQGDVDDGVVQDGHKGAEHDGGQGQRDRAEAEGGSGFCRLDEGLCVHRCISPLSVLAHRGTNSQ